MKQILLLLALIPILALGQSTKVTILGQHSSADEHSSKLMFLDLSPATDQLYRKDQSPPASETLAKLKQYFVQEKIDTLLIKSPYQIGNPTRSYRVEVSTDRVFNKMIKICDSLNISIRKIDYEFDNITAEELDAMAIKAVQDAEEKALSIAEALKLELVQIISIDDQISEYDPEAEEVLIEMIEAGLVFEGLQMLDDDTFIFSDDMKNSTRQKTTYSMLVTFEFRPKQKKD